MSEQVTPRPLTNDEKEWIVFANAGEAKRGIEVVANEEVDSGRWHSYHCSVFKMEGSEQLFGISYERGLTEQQEGDYPGLYGDNHNQFQPFKVKAVTKTITTYKEDK